MFLILKIKSICIIRRASIWNPTFKIHVTRSREIIALFKKRFREPDSTSRRFGTHSETREASKEPFNINLESRAVTSSCRQLRYKINIRSLARSDSVLIETTSLQAILLKVMFSLNVFQQITNSQVKQAPRNFRAALKQIRKTTFYADFHVS